MKVLVFLLMLYVVVVIDCQVSTRSKSIESGNIPIYQPLPVQENECSDKADGRYAKEKCQNVYYVCASKSKLFSDKCGADLIFDQVQGQCVSRSNSRDCAEPPAALILTSKDDEKVVKMEIPAKTDTVATDQSKSPENTLTSLLRDLLTMAANLGTDTDEGTKITSSPTNKTEKVTVNASGLILKLHCPNAENNVPTKPAVEEITKVDESTLRLKLQCYVVPAPTVAKSSDSTP